MDSNKQAELMWDAYQKICEDVPEVENPSRTDEKAHEMMILCECKENYRVFVNGEYGEVRESVNALDISCPHCGRHVSERRGSAQHSGGIFNAVVGRRII